MIYKVRSSEIEGQHALSEVTPLRLLKCRVFLSVLLSLLTCFIFALMLKWSDHFYYTFLFEQCEEAIGTHYLVVTANEEKFICKKRVENHNFFRFRLLSYTFNYQHKTYDPIQFLDPGLSAQQLIDKASQLSQKQKLQLYGKSDLQIPIMPLHTYLLEELTRPFFILQYMSVLLWIFEGFFYYSIVLMVSSLSCVMANYVLLRRSRLKLQQLANNTQKVKLIDGTFIQGSDLLPGDQFLVEDGQKLNCDSILLKGGVLINEATLTGESIPVPKQPINLSEPISFEKSQVHCLFEGTKIVKASTYTQNIALVVRTGFASQRGQYFRNVLFPSRESRKFYIQACKFLGGLAILVVSAYIVILIYKLIPLGYSKPLLITRFFDALTWIIPPALPIFFTYTQAASLLKLYRRGVLGSNPAKTEIAGRIDTVCFDKTGTLTQTTLKAKECYPQSQEIFKIMACCHHLIEVDGELIGDPLEIEMFTYSGWKIKFDDCQYFQVYKGDQRLEVIKIFEFSSAKQLMSVVVKDLSNNKLSLFVKGSPEVLSQRSLSNLDDYHFKLDQYTFEGLRVLGLAKRELEQFNDDSNLEIGLDFVGFFMLENSLKKDTPQVIKQLQEAKFEIKVISGDNALTTAHCAAESNIINSKNNLIIVDYDKLQRRFVIKDFSNISPVKSPLKNEPPEDTFLIVDELYHQNYDFAITGNAWDTLYAQFKQSNISIEIQSQSEISTISSFDTKYDLLDRVLKKTKVFSRMKPHHKKEIVYALQKQKHIVMMVGDGSNDCSAIAQAQVGVSFSTSDASYTAPFSYREESIECTIKILSQGRATICIIIEIFQYYIIISAIKFVGAMCMSLQGQNFSDLQFLYINYLACIPTLIMFTFSLSVDKLINGIPNDDMFALPNQLTMYNQIFCSSAGLCLATALVIDNLDYFELPSHINAYTRGGVLNTTIFLGSLFYFMSIPPQIYKSSPFKQPIYTNIPLFCWVIMCLSYVILMVMFNKTGSWLDVMDLDYFVFDGFNWILLLILVLSCIISIGTHTLFERVFPTLKTLK